MLADLGWETYRRGVDALPKYLMRNLPAHLLVCRRGEDAAVLLTDLSYLEAKIGAGLVFELADDIATVFKALPEGDHRLRLLAVLEAQARSEKTAMARMIIRCLAFLAEDDPAGVSKVVTTIVDHPVRGRGVAIAQANVRAVRVALEVAVAACRRDPLADAVRRVILAACASADSNVRSLAIVALFHLLHKNANYSLGLDILRELAQWSVRFGLPRPGPIEVFICCALGLFFERHNEKPLIGELKNMAHGVIARIWGLKFALWLVPNMISSLLDKISEEAYNPHNVAELKAYKKFCAAHPERAEVVRTMVDFIDPAYGSSEEFIRALRLYHRMPWPREAWYDMYSCSCASLAVPWPVTRPSWRQIMNRGHPCNPTTCFAKISCTGCASSRSDEELQGIPPLESKWTDRIEVATRNFMRVTARARAWEPENLPTFGATYGVVFLAHQLGQDRVPLLEELIEWACVGQGEEMLRWPETQRGRQADMLMMRLLEFVGVENGATTRYCAKPPFSGYLAFLDMRRNSMIPSGCSWPRS